MTPEFISRIVALLQKQGDRVILADSATGKTVVIMDLEQYEALSNPVEEVARAAPVQAAAQARPSPQPMMPTYSVPEAQIPQMYAEMYDHMQAQPFPQAHEEESVPEPRPVPRLEHRPEHRIEPRVEAPFGAPPIARKYDQEIPQKIAKNSDNPFKKRAKQLGVEEPLNPMDLADLTQTELLDKINRDIGVWKTAQDRKRTDELQSVAKRPKPFETEPSVGEEERFYLEPIE